MAEGVPVNHEAKILSRIKKVRETDMPGNRGQLTIHFYVRGMHDAKYRVVKGPFGKFYFWRWQWTFTKVHRPIMDRALTAITGWHMVQIYTQKREWVEIKSERMKKVLRLAAWPAYLLD